MTDLSYALSLARTETTRADELIAQIRQAAGDRTPGALDSTQAHSLRGGRAQELEQILASARRLAARSEADLALMLYRKVEALRAEYESLALPAEDAGGVDAARTEQNGNEVLASWSRTATDLAEAADITGALVLFRGFESTYGAAAMPSRSWHRLCRIGGLVGRPADVLDACDKALVNADAGARAALHESRGVVRALSGDADGAASDFEAYLQGAAVPAPSSSAQADLRNGWVTRLRAGEDPGAVISEQHIAAERRQESYRVRSARSRLLRESVPPDVVETSLAALVEVWLNAEPIRAALSRYEPKCVVRGTASQQPDAESIALCDTLWDQDHVWVVEMQGGECSVALDDIEDDVSALAEIFVTDAVGHNACVSRNKTTDYYQADEGWWQSAFVGTGRISFEYDSSTDASSVSIYVPVVDDAQRIMGVGKAVFDLEQVGAPLPPTLVNVFD